MKRKGGIRNSVEFIVRVREFWSCYLFIELVLYVLLLVVEPRSVTKVFGSQLLLPGRDGSHWCVFACKSKFENYRPVNIQRRRPATGITCVVKCFRAAAHRKALAIDTLMVSPFYPVNVYSQSLLVGYCANGGSKFSGNSLARSLWLFPILHQESDKRHRVDFCVSIHAEHTTLRR